jgi:phage shock protein A
MAKALPQTASVEPQPIEELKSRFERLDKRKTIVETNATNAEQTVQELQAEARRTYGTDDFNELCEKLATMKAENELKRRNYQAELDAIEAALAKIEAQAASAETSTGGATEPK